ncbi:MAG: ATP-binding protein [Anaerolineae bacterium]|jgi:signal transduction histidine kinase|nr:ATP-binding protein [Anaerolineae bacterium]
MILDLIAERQHIDTLNLRAREIWHQDVDAARALAEEAKQRAVGTLFGAGPYEKGVIDSTVMQAQCGLRLGEYEQALDRVAQALEFYRQHGIHDVWQLNAHYTMAVAYSTLGNQAEALVWCQTLVDLAKEMDESAYIALGLRNIGNLYGFQGDFETAIYFYSESVPYFESLSSKSGLAAVYGNYSWAYRQMGRLQEAMTYAERSLDIFQSVNDRDGQALTHILVGNLHLQQDDLIRASKHLHQGMDIAHEVGVAAYIADAALNMGRLYMRRGDLRGAVAYALDALNHSERMGHSVLIMNTHLFLSECYKQLQDWKASLDHHERYAALKDEIRAQEAAAKLQNLEVLYRTQQARREADVQRKLREEDVRYYQRINRMKDEVLNTASHDLKSPLVGIKQTVYSLRQHGKLDDAYGQQLLTEIERAVQQMGSLISSVLDLAKLETGRALDLKTHDIVPVIRSLVSEMMEAAQSAGIDLRIEISSGPVMATFDKDRLHQVIRNLFTNALKFTQRGGHIRLLVQSSTEYLSLLVADTGIGIPDYALPFVFERFYRVPEDAHRRVEGTGLGLAVVKTIVENHGGTVTVESKLHEGSVFTVMLPLAAGSPHRQHPTEQVGS